MPEFDVLIQLLLGQAVAAAEIDYGSYFTLYIGAITQQDFTVSGHSFNCKQSAVELRIGRDWRLESGTAIRCSSADSQPAMVDGLAVLTGQEITSLTVTGRIPELVIGFTSGDVLRTLTTAYDRYPAWDIKMGEECSIHPQDGSLWRSDGSIVSQLSDAEIKACLDAQEAAQRWSCCNPAPIDRRCRDCRWFIRLDGHGHMLDYGVCSASASEHDGRVVHFKFGCPQFMATE